MLETSSGGVMNNPVPATMNPNQHYQAVDSDSDSDSNAVFALGVVLLVCGAAITGRHEVTMIGLAMIIFSSLFNF
jgi:hypothetical protein